MWGEILLPLPIVVAISPIIPQETMFLGGC